MIAPACATSQRYLSPSSFATVSPDGTVYCAVVAPEISFQVVVPESCLCHWNVNPESSRFFSVTATSKR